jgi:predicted dithiol-disulfide oxidoreductase (DUF899 family)
MTPSSSIKGIHGHKVVSQNEWIEARKAFLAKEKEFTHLRDQLSQQRRELPWHQVDKEYVFEGPNGKETLSELFAKKSQLIIYHFMFHPDWDEGCPHCSFWADNFNGIDVHLKHRDVAFLAVSRAPLRKLETFKERMKWSFKWISPFGSDFNYDYYASFTPEEIEKGTAFYNYKKQNLSSPEVVGASAFYKDGKGAVFHTYSCYSRGVDMLNGAYNYLDLAPKGRDEDELEFTQEWVRHHDRYDD